MPPAPPSDRDLDAYREQADRFIAELDEEFYLHYAGHKETFDLSPIYEDENAAAFKFGDMIVNLLARPRTS